MMHKNNSDHTFCFHLVCPRGPHSVRAVELIPVPTCTLSIQMLLLGHQMTVAFDNKLEEARNEIFHLASNLLSHYLVKSSVHMYNFTANLFH